MTQPLYLPHKLIVHLINLTKNQIQTIHVRDLQHFSAKKKLKNHFFL